jgi:predicted component of type VI protein secretion system
VPYIVIKSNGQEIERRELDKGLVIGRAPDCDITVRDILLSRRHCRIQPSDDGWMIQDLQSKNGTVINGERLRGPKILADHDVVRFGRAKIVFHAGLPEDDFCDNVLAPARPYDPGDSLAGTLSGFTLLLPGEGEIPEDMPCPQPRPKDPPAYERQEIQELLTAIASSSWDSVYAEARQPLRVGRAAEMEENPIQRRRVRPSTPMDFSLQVSPAPVPAPVAVAVAAASISLPVKSRSGHFRPSLHAAVALVWVAFLILLNSSRTPAVAPARQVTPVPARAVQADGSSDSDSQTAAEEESTDSTDSVSPKQVKFDPKSAASATATTAFYLEYLW